MSQCLLINHIQVQGANAVSGFTWGFPAITHFLGFVHNLNIKMANKEEFADIQLSGCAVIAHSHNVHTYGGKEKQFIQSKNPAYLKNDVTKVMNGKSPSVIEEGKMNMDVSLLIACEGNIGGGREKVFIQWLETMCQRQRLAGGTILNIATINLFSVEGENSRNNLRAMICQLLPGFVLLDRSAYLEKHFESLQEKNPEAEVFDAWMDFIALKQKARPVYDLINRHLIQMAEKQTDSDEAQKLLEQWQQHLDEPYESEKILDELKSYFASIEETKNNKKLLTQWAAYCEPNNKTDAVWEYIKKPEPGFLVPIMTGYKAISPVYKNHEVANTRDNETDVCFVEAVHSIGEWQGVHRIRNETLLKQTLWDYHYENNWYLCRQKTADELTHSTENEEPLNDDYS